MRTYLLTVLAAVVALATFRATAANERPNILVFLSDDVGWGEYGFQGNADIPTPNIDSIAKNGVRFTQGYVSGPYCSPTRAGLLTGRYQTRFGHEFNSTAQASGLSLDETTFPERMKELGYATCAIGKWHLGNKPRYRPMNRGFDEFYGTLGNSAFFKPRMFIDSRVSSEPRQITDEDFYTTDAYADRAVDWIDRHKDGPWFLYVPFNAQHAPLQATEEYLDRFDHILGQKRQTFAAMMSGMDDAVGRVLDKVRDEGQEENTLVFFLADNGGPTGQTTSSNFPLRGYKATTWEGGIRVPFCAQWKGKLPTGRTYDNPIIQLDILPTSLAAASIDADPTWKLDGVNLLPYLTGDKSERPHDALYWRFGEQWAIRDGDWKLVAGTGGNRAGELYNLAEDKSESQNLAAAMPDKVRELKDKWGKWNVQQAPPSAPREQPAARANQPAKRNRARQQAAE